VTTNPLWIAGLGTEFNSRFGRDAAPKIALAPGRVNLIGEHTDYNEGWVLPMAVDRWVGIAFGRRDDRRIRARSVVFDETREFGLDDLAPPGGSDWFSFVAAAAWVLGSAGHRVSGVDFVVNGDVPLGSGLSSSSALTMASMLALCEASAIEWAPVEMALLGHRAERDYIGVEGGLMDQFTSVMGRAGHALLLDCRTLEADFVPVPAEAAIVVLDTGAPRTLATSAYNDRSRSCRAAVEELRDADPEIQALRDVEPGFLEFERGRLDEITYRRALHVVEEMTRPFAMALALAESDLVAAGHLMNESHISLRDLFEVSSPELDLFVELAQRHPCCFGARLTGAGFGGCAIALVAAESAPAFADEVHAAYRAEVNLPSSVFICRPVSGARIVDLG
jgi:galactokinase